ncbi:RimK/LysX family protein [Pseudomonas sp. MN1F]|uniref:putative ATP-dependent zinc protease n=1 Tax=Pseudomonas sp. MN1F TaxID=1366632 RepID=UPI0015B70BB0|nr:RimK/LysX family protein [Pseudomonas sp. MN1F]
MRPGASTTAVSGSKSRFLHGPSRSLAETSHSDFWKMGNGAGELIAALFASLLLHPSVPTGNHPYVIGWAEESLVWPEKIAIRTKLDTGTEISSLDARNPIFFQKNGVEWVRFNLALKDNNTGQLVNQVFEREIVAPVATAQTTSRRKRKAVDMEICFGQQLFKETFALDDRSAMHYPMVIGRPLIAKLGVVDSSRTFTIEPHCKSPSS